MEEGDSSMWRHPFVVPEEDLRFQPQLHALGAATLFDVLGGA